MEEVSVEVSEIEANSVDHDYILVVEIHCLLISRKIDTRVIVQNIVNPVCSTLRYTMARRPVAPCYEYYSCTKTEK